MKQKTSLIRTVISMLLYFTVFMIPHMSMGQQSMIINMAPIDGISITPANIFGYQVHAGTSMNVDVKGSIRYRNSGLTMSYSFTYALKSGINMINKDLIQPHWQFSSSALRELFFNYNTLPGGTFEYCVSITPVNAPKESNSNSADECLYHRTDDFFLINLIDPSDKSKLKEYNPALSWIANYSFSNELTYRVRVAEMKQGQNAVNAVLRNQPVYDERNLMRNSIIYPIYAKPLVANQPYAWTVDAYYKGILLGGAESWQFIIVDSLPVTQTGNRSYIDVKMESGLNMLVAPGSIKLKYVLDDAKIDVLSLEILNENNVHCSLSQDKLNAVYGDNRYIVDLLNSAALKHKGTYTLRISTKTGHEYKLTFQYLNPEFKF